MEILKHSTTDIIYGDLFPIQDGACLIQDTMYVELNQRGLILFYETLHGDKRLHGQQIISYVLTITMLAHFIKLILKCYEKLKLDVLVRIDISLENIRGFKLQYGNSEYLILDPIINTNHFISISAIALQPHISLAPLLKKLFWGCGFNDFTDNNFINEFKHALNQIYQSKS